MAQVEQELSRVSFIRPLILVMEIPTLMTQSPPQGSASTCYLIGDSVSTYEFAGVGGGNKNIQAIAAV